MKLKKTTCTTLALSIMIGSINISNANNLKLNDITNDYWAKNEIQNFIEKEYINGYPDNTFRPENPITRAEFIKVVNKVFGYTKTTQINFTDIESNMWYYQEIQKAVNAGYIDGYPEDNTFRPENPITREEAAKIISTIKNNQDNNIDKLEKYNDSKETSPWAKPYVEGMLEAGYMNGYSENNTFRPKQNIKRSEAVVTLSRTQNNIKIMYTTASDGLNVRTGPGTQYESLGKLPLNTKVEVIEIKDGWAKINYNNGVAYVSASYLTDSQQDPTQPRPLPQIPETPKNIDAPQHPKIVDSTQDENQGKIVLEKTIEEGKLTDIVISEANNIEIEYSVYANGKWITKTNDENANVDLKPIEGIKINFKQTQGDRHIFYRTKIKGKGWQAWVNDGKLSGEIGNNNIIEDIQIREIISTETDEMVKPTIAVDIGHNVERPLKAGSIGLYKEDTLTKAIGERVIYKLREQGYNVVETLPTGRYSQNDELNIRAKVANLNEVDKFISIHFNTFDKSANGTEAYYAERGSSKDMATKISKNMSDSFGFRNRGAKSGSHLAVLKLTKMPAVLVEGCFIDNVSDMNKFINKGTQAYDIMADNIIQGALN